MIPVVRVTQIVQGQPTATRPVRGAGIGARGSLPGPDQFVLIIICIQPQAKASCLWLFMQVMAWALILALLRAGSNMPAKMAIMAITTNNSINVNAL